MKKASLGCLVLCLAMVSGASYACVSNASYNANTPTRGPNLPANVTLCPGGGNVTLNFIATHSRVFSLPAYASSPSGKIPSHHIILTPNNGVTLNGQTNSISCSITAAMLQKSCNNFGAQCLLCGGVFHFQNGTGSGMGSLNIQNNTSDNVTIFFHG